MQNKKKNPFDLSFTFLGEKFSSDDGLLIITLCAILCGCRYYTQCIYEDPAFTAARLHPLVVDTNIKIDKFNAAKEAVVEAAALEEIKTAEAEKAAEAAEKAAEVADKAIAKATEAADKAIAKALQAANKSIAKASEVAAKAAANSAAKTAEAAEAANNLQAAKMDLVIKFTEANKAREAAIAAGYIGTESDAAEKGQLGFQDPASPTVEGMILFNDFLTLLLLIIAIFVCWILFKLVSTYNKNNIIQKFTHSSLLEIVWTLIPAFLLLIIAVPSFSLLYALDEITNPLVTLKIVGHQWYWSYEYSDLIFGDSANINFDSYMLSVNDLTYGAFRLLEVDNRVVLPINTHIRLLVTAADVLHSWAVPSFGIKVDACPGRLSQASLFIKREGTFYGQCSEICGTNHGFMPVVIRTVSLDIYTNWIISKYIDEIN